MFRSRILGLGVGFYSLEQRRDFLDTNCSGLVLKIARCIFFSIAIHAKVTRSKVAGFPSSIVGLKSFTSRSWEAYLALKNKGFAETETKGKTLKRTYNFKEKGSLQKCRTPVF
jgi:hypothetical protein